MTVPQRVVVVGQGYVGLPIAVRSAEVGHRVLGFDVDEARIKRLAVGDSFVPDVSDERLARVLANGSYRAVLDPDDLDGFDVAVIAVPTPLRDQAPDLRYITAAATMLASRLRRGATVILESTTYPGTTEEVVAPLLSQNSGLEPGTDFHLGYSPERIDPGNPDWPFERIPKIVSGVDEASLEKVHTFYAGIVDSTFPVGAPRVAELAKLVENTFRSVNIALVNELASVTHDLGIDIWEALDAAATKPFGFMRFVPGPGVGGHCLPVDPLYLSWHARQRLGRGLTTVETAHEINHQQPAYVVRRLSALLNRRRRSLNGSRVLLLGLAYKAGCGDVRESPAVRVASLLDAAGARLRVVDPHVDQAALPDLPGVWTTLTDSEVSAADAVLLLTDHDEFDYELVTRDARCVMDCRRRLPAAAHVEHL